MWQSFFKVPNFKFLLCPAGDSLTPELFMKGAEKELSICSHLAVFTGGRALQTQTDLATLVNQTCHSNIMLSGISTKATTRLF